ncbi:MAG: DeoR/GlpR family DNA-binding transcription regulator [Muribaculaceae bacterium]|nr:DeoR/GlpR family DNA-binding transcription regulator [Muribaculaceae bacterium]MDY3933164.1 DeoR/GlpR family DNA-binding transcription regulator [Muribaculaceae bacterium]
MISIAERHKHILDCLARDGYVRVAEMAKELDVTTVTIRKDLKYLEEKKLLYRTHGSASPVNPQTQEVEVREKEKIHIDEKRRIAMAAAQLIEPDDSIIIASGSTVQMLGDFIQPQGHLTVVTSSLKTAVQLNSMDRVDVIQLGGNVRKNSLSVVGVYTSQFFEQITCSKLFLGVDGIDLDYGITNSNIEEALLNIKMIEASQRTIIMADSSKFGRRGFGRICNLDRIDVIITDSGITASVARAIEDAGIELIIT